MAALWAESPCACTAEIFAVSFHRVSSDNPAILALQSDLPHVSSGLSVRNRFPVNIHTILALQSNMPHLSVRVPVRIHTILALHGDMPHLSLKSQVGIDTILALQRE